LEEEPSRGEPLESSAIFFAGGAYKFFGGVDPLMISLFFKGVLQFQEIS